jgi:hypothetical protein
MGKTSLILLPGLPGRQPCGCRKLIRGSDLALRLRTRSSCESRLNAFRNRASNLEHAQLQHTIAGDVSDTAQVTGLTG